MTSDPSSEISCRDVWKVFGKHPERIIQSIRSDQSRSQILDSTGHVVAVRSVSFDVRSAETFVVMGLSGSGKSTLVRCISRLTDPTHGQIIIGGQDVMKMDEKRLLELARPRGSLGFQYFRLF